jgi:hypothetical protein
MARTKSNPLLQGVSGKIGDQLVIKQYPYGTVISAMPDMSGVKKSRRQKEEEQKFAKAVAYAKSITRNPVKKAAYAKKLKKGKLVYHAAIQEFYSKHKA